MDRDFSDELIALLPRLRRFARMRTRSEADADDLVQATVERALSRSEQFTPGTRLDSWLYRIAQNLHLNDIRRGDVRRRGLKVVETTAVGTEAGGAEAHTDLKRVRGFVAELPEEQRQALLLVAVEGYGYAEAADILGVPIGTVTSRLARARTALKEMRDGGGREAHA